MQNNLVLSSQRRKLFWCATTPAFLFFILLPIVLFGQQSQISGTILDANNSPISFVTVLVLQTAAHQDSHPALELVKGTTTDDLGNFTLEDVDHATYTLQFSFIGFETQTKNITLTTNTALGQIILLENSPMLEEAVIILKKPTIEKAPGRLVFNIENTAVASGNALDVLKKTPGVVVSQQGISVKNNSPVIYLHNKRIYLSGEETR